MITATFDPEKWQLVPKEPSPDMKICSRDVNDRHPDWGSASDFNANIYRIMLAAAPERPESAWRPIESAPKDGSRFIGFGRNEYFCCHWSRDFNRFISGFAPDPNDVTRMLILEVEPTHWMPLPEPPKE